MDPALCHAVPTPDGHQSCATPLSTTRCGGLEAADTDGTPRPFTPMQTCTTAPRTPTAPLPPHPLLGTDIPAPTGGALSPPTAWPCSLAVGQPRSTMLQGQAHTWEHSLLPFIPSKRFLSSMEHATEGEEGSVGMRRGWGTNRAQHELLPGAWRSGRLLLAPWGVAHRLFMRFLVWRATMRTPLHQQRQPKGLRLGSLGLFETQNALLSARSVRV